jgi:chromosome segregation ATPase
MNPNDTPTPRTDEKQWSPAFPRYSRFVVSADFSRKLETELTEAKAEVERLESINLAQSTIIKGAKEEMDKLKAEVAKLNQLMFGWKQRATMSETTLEATQKDLRRAVEIAEELYENRHSAWTVYMDEIFQELKAIKATINPETK